MLKTTTFKNLFYTISSLTLAFTLIFSSLAGLIPVFETKTAQADGITWTPQDSAVENAWTSVTYGNGKFVAVARTGEGNRVMTSPDGIDWTIRASAADNSWNSVTYGTVDGEPLFVAVSFTGIGNRVMTSPDGINWTIRASAADNSWNSVTYGTVDGEPLFVAVATSGTDNRVMTSPDGINWTIRASAVNNNWRSVTYGTVDGEPLFVAVATYSGNSNQVMTSPDGINWTMRTSAAALQWNSVTYGEVNGEPLFVAVSNYAGGGTNQVMTSPDGIDWTIRASAADNSWNSVTYTNGLFVAVAYSGTGNRVMTSEDGINWTARASAADNNWLSVTYGNGLFVAVASNDGNNQVMISGAVVGDVDDTAPIITTITPADDTTGLSVDITELVITFDEDVVASTTDNILYIRQVSDDAIVYQVASNDSTVTIDGSTVTIDLDGVTFSEGTGYYVGFESGAFSDISGNFHAGISDAVTWNFATDYEMTWTPQNAAEANSWHSVAYGNGKFVAVAQDGDNRVMTSTNGVDWDEYAVELNSWRSIIYANGLFVAVSSSGDNRVMTSPDGVIWTEHDEPGSSWYGITYGDGLFVATAITGSNLVMTSTNGFDWTAQTAAEANSWRSVTYGDGLFVAVADSGDNRVMTSPDGINWTPGTTPTPASNWQSVTYADDMFVAVASGGTNRVMTSFDGITWVPHSAAAASNWQSVIYGSGLFVAVAYAGAGNRVMTSGEFVDVIAPIVTAFSPSDNATGVSVNLSEISITFNEPIFAGITNNTLTIYRTSNDNIVYEMEADETPVNISGNTAIFDLVDTEFDYNTEYYVQFTSSTFRDAAGNYHDGITGTTTWSFTTEEAEAIPVDDWTNSVEDDAGNPIAGAEVIMDVSCDNINHGAVVTTTDSNGVFTLSFADFLAILETRGCADDGESLFSTHFSASGYYTITPIQDINIVFGDYNATTLEEWAEGFFINWLFDEYPNGEYVFELSPYTDGDPLEITTLTPTAGSTNVPANTTNFTLTFNKAVSLHESATAYLKLYNEEEEVYEFWAGDEDESITISNGGLTVTLHLPSELLKPSTRYYIELDEAFAYADDESTSDTLGNKSFWNFTTAGSGGGGTSSGGSGSSSSGGSGRTYCTDTVTTFCSPRTEATTPTISTDTTTLLSQLKTLITQFISMGGTPTAEMKALIGTGTGTTAGTSTTPGLCPRYTFTHDLRFGDQGEDVRALQRFLNCAGFQLATSGPGAPGEETSYFVDRTRTSVIRFQEQYSTDILVPINAQQGTGIFAGYSRAKAHGLMATE